MKFKPSRHLCCSRVVIVDFARLNAVREIHYFEKQNCFFYELILLWSDNTNQIMQNPIQKLRQSSIFFEKPGFLSEKLKNLTSSNYHRVQCFLLKLHTCVLLTNVYKSVFGIFFILFRSWVICKNRKDLVSTHSFLTFLLVTQDLNKIRNIPNTFLWIFFSRKPVQNFRKKYQTL